jgi:hypothetical protein
MVVWIIGGYLAGLSSLLYNYHRDQDPGRGVRDARDYVCEPVHAKVSARGGYQNGCEGGEGGDYCAGGWVHQRGQQGREAVAESRGGGVPRRKGMKPSFHELVD